MLVVAMSLVSRASVLSRPISFKGAETHSQFIPPLEMAGVVNVYTDTRLPIALPYFQKEDILIESPQRLSEPPYCNKDVLRARLAGHVEKRRFIE